MHIVTYFIIAIFVYLVFLIAKKENLKAENLMNENNFTISQPKLFLWIGLIGGIFFLGLEIFMTIKPNETSEWWVHLIFISFSLVSFVLTFYCLRFEIKIVNNQIIYSKFIGKRVYLTVDQITKVKYIVDKEITVFCGNKRVFSVDFNSKGFKILVSRLGNEGTIHFEY